MYHVREKENNTGGCAVQCFARTKFATMTLHGQQRNWSPCNSLLSQIDCSPILLNENLHFDCQTMSTIIINWNLKGTAYAFSKMTSILKIWTKCFSKPGTTRTMLWSSVNIDDCEKLSLKDSISKFAQPFAFFVLHTTDLSRLSYSIIKMTVLSVYMSADFRRLMPSPVFLPSIDPDPVQGLWRHQYCLFLFERFFSMCFKKVVRGLPLVFCVSVFFCTRLASSVQFLRRYLLVCLVLVKE